jgi:hypothetical protein
MKFDFFKLKDRKDMLVIRYDEESHPFLPPGPDQLLIDHSDRCA